MRAACAVGTDASRGSHSGRFAAIAAAFRTGADPKPLFSNCLRFRIAVAAVVSGCEAVLTVYCNTSVIVPKEA